LKFMARPARSFVASRRRSKPNFRPNHPVRLFWSSRPTYAPIALPEQLEMPAQVREFKDVREAIHYVYENKSNTQFHCAIIFHATLGTLWDWSCLEQRRAIPVGLLG
jgi:hypothetical protein